MLQDSSGLCLQLSDLPCCAFVQCLGWGAACEALIRTGGLRQLVAIALRSRVSREKSDGLGMKMDEEPKRTVQRMIPVLIRGPAKGFEPI